nr:hypothetical protein CFP56_40018 [Quercus suber]
MSENHSSEQVLEVSGAQNNNSLDPNPDRAIRAPEEANGYDHDRVNQEPALLQVGTQYLEFVQMRNRLIENSPDYYSLVGTQDLEFVQMRRSHYYHCLCKLICSALLGSKVKVGKQRSPSNDDVNFQRARYKKSEGSDDTNSGDTTHASYHELSISEVVETSHEMESQALINTPEDENFMEDLVNYDSPNNLAKGDRASFSIGSPDSTVPELQQLSFLIEHADNVPDHLTRKFILDTINQVSSYFTISNTFYDFLRHPDLINKSLSRLQGIVSGDYFGKATVEWFSELIHRVLGMDDDHACKFFIWLDTNTYMRGTATTLIVIGKFRWLEFELEVANEELTQARAMEEAALEQEQVAKQRVERAKVARKIAEEKAEKFKRALVIAWAMFGALRLFSTKFEEVEMR